MADAGKISSGEEPDDRRNGRGSLYRSLQAGTRKNWDSRNCAPSIRSGGFFKIMSANKKSFKALMSEPAERPFMVALSDAEMLALIHHHIKEMRHITKSVGNKLMDLRANNPFAGARTSRILIDAGKDLMNAHAQRAKGLQSILEAKSC
jgi:hypothetical protein